MKKIILTEKQVRKLFEADWNFHHGKDHDGKPYYSENRYICQHETGQFGSGTYFSSFNMPSEHNNDMNDYVYAMGGILDPHFTQMRGADGERKGIYRVDLDIYKNLYRVKSERQGDLLHTMMSYLNGFFNKVSGCDLGRYRPQSAKYDNARIYQIIERNAKALGLECPSYLKLTRMAQEHAKSDRPQSFSTVFMEMNGYNGVNVSGINKFDNSRHGSVIYDLSKTSDDYKELDTASNPHAVGYGHTRSVASDFWNLKDEANAKSLIGSFGRLGFKEMDSREKLRVLKNLFDGDTRYIDIEDILMYIKDEPQCQNYVFRKIYFDKSISPDRILTYSVMRDIVEADLTYFINYIPERYKYHPFLMDFIRKYCYDIEEREEKEKIINNLVGMLEEPLTSEDKEDIEDYLESGW